MRQTIRLALMILSIMVVWFSLSCASKVDKIGGLDAQPPLDGEVDVSAGDTANHDAANQDAANQDSATDGAVAVRNIVVDFEGSADDRVTLHRGARVLADEHSRWLNLQAAKGQYVTLDLDDAQLGDGLRLEARLRVGAFAPAGHIPAGTYLVSATLERRLKDKLSEHLGMGHAGRPINGMTLIGEDRDRTIIKLKENVSGFAYPERPKSVIKFASSVQVGRLTSLIDAAGDLLPGVTAAEVIAAASIGGKNLKEGEGNDAYQNNLRNLTVLVGSGNPRWPLIIWATTVGARRM